MDGNDKVENLLIKLSISYEKLSEDVFVINERDKGINNLILSFNDEFLTIKLRITKINNISLDFLTEILKLNYDMMYGFYAIDDDDYICIVNTLEISSLNIEVLEMCIDSITLSFAQNYNFFLNAKENIEKE